MNARCATVVLTSALVTWCMGPLHPSALATLHDSSHTPSRPLSDEEEMAYALDANTIVVLARVIKVDSTSAVRLKREWGHASWTLEPIEFVKGGLDGDHIEALTSNEETSRALLDSKAVGADTLAVLAPLSAYDGDWLFRSMSFTRQVRVMVAPQRKWKSELERVRSVLAQSDPDSLAANADLIVIGAPLSPGAVGFILFKIERLLKGASKERYILVRAIHSLPEGRQLLYLRREPNSDVSYETIPFHSVWSRFPAIHEGENKESEEEILEVVEAIHRAEGRELSPGRTSRP